MTLFDTMIELEENDDVHLGRLLLLISAFQRTDGLAAIDSLTKLAKLDFLLRYPVVLERALKAKGIDASKVFVQMHERDSVESKMVRFRYGPWDFRYRRFLNLLACRGLCKIHQDGRTISISLTPRGAESAEKLKATEQYDDVTARSILLKKYFDKSGNSLKDFVYATFPEVTSLSLGEEIN